MTDHHTHGPGCPCPPTAVVSSSPDIPDEAVEAALASLAQHQYDVEDSVPWMRRALVAAYPALTRQAVAADRVRWLNVTDAVAAERDRIATAIEAAPAAFQGVIDVAEAARIARAGGTP